MNVIFLVRCFISAENELYYIYIWKNWLIELDWFIFKLTVNFMIIEISD